MTVHPKPVWLLFDWGDTLMRIFPEYDGPMVNWPKVDAMPHALETLRTLGEKYHLAVATNAEDSNEEQIRAALDRAGLGSSIEEIFCVKRLARRKPERAYFLAIAEHLSVLPSQMVMIGDSLASDIQGAVSAGLQGIWLNLSSIEAHPGQGIHTVHSLKEVEQVLQSLEQSAN